MCVTGRTPENLNTSRDSLKKNDVYCLPLTFYLHRLRGTNHPSEQTPDSLRHPDTKPFRPLSATAQRKPKNGAHATLFIQGNDRKVIKRWRKNRPKR